MESLKSQPVLTDEQERARQGPLTSTGLRGPTEPIARPRRFKFDASSEENLSEELEAWRRCVTRGFQKRKSGFPDLSEGESVVDLLDLLQGPRTAVLNSLYRSGKLPQGMEEFKILLVQLYRAEPSNESAYEDFERAYQKKDMSVRHCLLHLEDLQRCCYVLVPLFLSSTDRGGSCLGGWRGAW